MVGYFFECVLSVNVSTNFKRRNGIEGIKFDEFHEFFPTFKSK